MTATRAFQTIFCIGVILCLRGDGPGMGFSNGEPVLPPTPA